MFLVCIGASAGGLQPIIDILGSIRDTEIDASFVVVQHLARDKKSLMKEILAQKVVLPVVEITNSLSVDRGQIYLCPPGFTAGVRDGHFVLESLELDFPNKAIDHFFESVANEWKENAIGVILSGTGSDGVIGCQNLYEKGSFVLVQNPDQAEFSGMPNSIIKSGFYNQSFETSSFYSLLDNLLKKPREDYDETIFNHVKANMTEFSAMAKEDLNLSLDSFKSPTLCRRIAKSLKQEGFHDVESYLEFLRRDLEKRRELFDQLMINVTHFFRDPDFFHALKEHLTKILRKNQPEFRFWVCGCSTGEEAYSLAILINEIKAQLKENVSVVKIFATDINSVNIQEASQGIYSENDVKDLPKNYLKKYFDKHDQTHYRVNDLIRGMIIFSVHDVVHSPPFSRMDLVTCRNLLIYLKQVAQSKALANLVFSLNLHGALCLGPSESLGVLGKYFKTIDRKWRIFTKQQLTRLALNNRLESVGMRQNQKVPQKTSQGHPFALTLSPTLLLDGLIKKNYPHSLILDDSQNVLAFYGRGRELLKKEREGFLSNQFEDLFNAELDLPFMASLIKAKEQKIEVVLQGALKEPEGFYDLHIQFIDDENGNSFYLLNLNFSEGRPEKREKVSTVDLSDSNSIIESLRSEILFLKKELRSHLEDKEQLNEELQTSNEELIASNEELQSTNEELNSVNEELYTLNNELQAKMDLVTTSHTDLNNLIETTNVGVIFLSPDLTVRRTTKNIENIFYIREGDIGRDVFELDFGAYLENVKEKLKTKEEHYDSYEILSKDNIYYKLDIKPYRDGHGLGRGYVVTLTNVDEAKRNEIFLEDTQSDASIGSWILDLKTGKTKWSREVYNIYEIPLGTPTNLAQGKASYPGEEQKKLERYIKGASSGISFADIFRFVTPSSKLKYVRVTGKPILNNKEEVTSLRGSIQDVTAFHLKEASTQEALFAAKTAIFEWFPLNDRLEVDATWNTIFEVERQDPSENLQTWLDSVHPEDREEFEKASAYALEKLPSYDLSYRIVTPKGDVKYVQVRFQIIRDESHSAIRVFGTITDVTKIKSTETQLKEQYKLMAQTTKMAQLGEISAGIGHEINNPLAIALGIHRLLEKSVQKIDFNNDSLDNSLESSFEKYLKDQKESLLRIRDLVKSLKNFAYTKSYENQIFDLSETIEDTTNLFKVLFDKKEIILKSNVQKGLMARGNKERFNQVLTNLFSNAIDAMDEVQGEKAIFLSTSKNDRMISFSIKDSGAGVPFENQERIFNQFFTTKTVGKGTGIGLALCRNIIQQMEGELILEQKQNEGAKFIINLPEVDIQNMEEKIPCGHSSMDHNHLSQLRGAIIDDEVNYLSLVKNELQEYGPSVDQFTSPIDFFKTLDQDLDNHYDFVITDVNMPEMTGFELLEKLTNEYHYSREKLFVISGGMPNFIEKKIKHLASEIFVKPVEVYRISEALLKVPTAKSTVVYSREEIIDKLLVFFEHLGPKVSVSTTLVKMTKEGKRPTIYVNKAFTEETGFSFEEVKGKNLKLLQSPKTKEDTIHFMRKCFEKKESCVVDINNRRKNGEDFINRLVMVPIEIGDFLFYLGLQNDITAYQSQEGVILHKDIKSIIHLPLSKIINEMTSFFYQKDPKTSVRNDVAQRLLSEIDHINNYILRL